MDDNYQGPTSPTIIYNGQGFSVGDRVIYNHSKNIWRHGEIIELDPFANRCRIKWDAPEAPRTWIRVHALIKII
jgi:hypothetical protein